MSDLVSTIADLTAFRDRDRVDVTLAGALRDLLRPKCISVWSGIGVQGSERWFMRAMLAEGDVAAHSDPTWVEVDHLPALESVPLRHQCLVSQKAIFQPGSPALSLFPLVSDRGVGGVLELQTDQPLTTEQRHLVCSLLRIYHNFQSLLDDSERDTLTGLLNRKTFDEHFLRLAAGVDSASAPVDDGDPRRSVAAGQRVFLGVIDIDHFKSVNDRFGHLIGDEVLLLLSRLMRSTFRYGDRLYRFGGEEFVVVMHCASHEAALHAFERLRQNVQRFAFPQAGEITVSIGFTEVTGRDTPSAAFGRADQAVYFAKGHGRNQVHDHASLLARAAISGAATTGDVELF